VNVAVLLLPPCSLSSVAPVIDTLRLAAEMDGDAGIEWRVVSTDGHAVALGGGAHIEASGAFTAALECDWLIVVNERFDASDASRRVIDTLRQSAARAQIVAAVHEGAWWLASAGLLGGYRVAVNWTMALPFADEFTDSISTQHIFEIDRDRATCSGGQPIADFMLALLARVLKRETIERIADALSMNTLRTADERQRIPYVTAPGEGDPRLNDALQLMEANVEEPLATDEIAALVGISRRQLERLFRQYLNAMPARYYLNLRLAKARMQLRRSSQSVVQISLACGFASAAHFSNAYRERFGVTPREDRRNWIERHRSDSFES
jgi:transcriptional regulator GlxA family with amidase domain